MCDFSGNFFATIEKEEPDDTLAENADHIQPSATEPHAPQLPLPEGEGDAWNVLSLHDPMTYMVPDEIVNNDVQFNRPTSDVTTSDPLEDCNSSFLEQKKVNPARQQVKQEVDHDSHFIEEIVPAWPCSVSFDFVSASQSLNKSIEIDSVSVVPPTCPTLYDIGQTDEVSASLAGRDCDAVTRPTTIHSIYEDMELNFHDLDAQSSQGDTMSKIKRKQPCVIQLTKKPKPNIPVIKIDKLQTLKLVVAKKQSMATCTASSTTPLSVMSTMFIEANQSDVSDFEEESDWHSGADSPSFNCSPVTLTTGSISPLPQPSDPQSSATAATCPHQNCAKVFRNTVCLRKHLAHHGPKLHACSDCGRAFVQASKLRRHRLVHTGERPHLCDFPGCGRRFSLAHNLNTHRRMHTGDRPFACPHPGCPKKFAQRNNLKSHMRIHHRLNGNGVQSAAPM